MKHTGYTPGPWLAATKDNLDTDGAGVFAHNKAGLPYYIALCRYMGSGDPSRAIANARLIADAPRLAEENEKLRGILVLILDAATHQATGWSMEDIADECKAALAGREAGK